MNTQPESIDVETIAQLPATEIGRWIVRIDRIKGALESDITVQCGGEMGDDGQVVWVLAQKARQGHDWQQGKDYEDAILYQMKAYLGLEKVEEAPSLDVVLPPTNTQSPKWERTIGNIALQEGLERTELLQRDAAHRLFVPLGAIAAFHYKKGDINDPIDWSLHESRRKEEIRSVVQGILESPDAKMRIIEYPIELPKTGKRIVRESIFRAIGWMEPAYLESVGLSADDAMTPWWQELQSNLKHIDAASDNL